MIAIIDYGFGNLRSVSKALSLLSIDSKITDSKKVIEDASSIIFPGVGSFGDCIKNLDDKKIIEPIKSSIKKGKPFLGICLGLQILFENSEESPGSIGFSFFKGSIDKIEFESNKLKVPHMGWNQVLFKGNSRLFRGIPDKSWFYFVHSFKSNINAHITDSISNYGDDFSSSISSDNIYATQFHPEKSSTVGLKVLKNFSQIS
ncbi:imidazole glycerol phosphate synthase subunit HisH [bacterium]|nr:imidazole glycerol phosphate synthase subunit HisH [bacterium]MBT3794999.1 imidazole glycerol phosphate synthase subunit HisH [bacterium]MBT4634037.1 imidazole glycerol phosphate synthase subunit HisH [bacterium]